MLAKLVKKEEECGVPLPRLEKGQRVGFLCRHPPPGYAWLAAREADGKEGPRTTDRIRTPLHSLLSNSDPGPHPGAWPRAGDGHWIPSLRDSLKKMLTKPINDWTGHNRI